MGQLPTDVIGLIPAAGLAKRLGSLPCSKELFPVGFDFSQDDPRARPKIVTEYLLERFQVAGIKRAYIILRSGKWDIPTYLGDGKQFNMHLAYLLMGVPFGAPYTLDQAYPFIQATRIALGFPDIIFAPEDAYLQIIKHQEITQADVVLGLFPSEHVQKMDMVDTDNNGQVRRIVIKPAHTKLHYTWSIAVWLPTFSRYMHNYLTDRLIQRGVPGDRRESFDKELYLGDVMNAAIDAGFAIQTKTFRDGWVIDIGTPEDLLEAVKRYAHLDCT